MVAIAMTREMGTLGKDVAQGIADQLDLKVIHHEVVEHDLAERLGMQESAVHRYLEGEASILETVCCIASLAHVGEGAGPWQLQLHYNSISIPRA